VLELEPARVRERVPGLARVPGQERERASVRELVPGLGLVRERERALALVRTQWQSTHQ
jgi:hypothetical protein